MPKNSEAAPSSFSQELLTGTRAPLKFGDETCPVFNPWVAIDVCSIWGSKLDSCEDFLARNIGLNASRVHLLNQLLSGESTLTLVLLIKQVYNKVEQRLIALPKCNLNKTPKGFKDVKYQRKEQILDCHFNFPCKQSSAQVFATLPFYLIWKEKCQRFNLQTAKDEALAIIVQVHIGYGSISKTFRRKSVGVSQITGKLSTVWIWKSYESF